MSTDAIQAKAAKRIAIIGSGISGLSCAYFLNKQHKVTIFEQQCQLGGHTATKTVEVQGQSVDVDTGFIVFNDRTYPNFLRLLDTIGVEVQPTEMSFSVHNEITGLEYNGHTLNTLFADRGNLLNRSFLHLLLDICRFNRLAKQAFLRPSECCGTLSDFLMRRRFDGLSYRLSFSQAGKDYRPGAGFELREDFSSLQGRLAYGILPGEKSKFPLTFNCGTK